MKVKHHLPLPLSVKSVNLSNAMSKRVFVNYHNGMYKNILPKEVSLKNEIEEIKETQINSK